ncbi:helix-turn-helix domain-containing protein [Mucilaginibacter gilvus]|uniref:AraC family transcriptional regulator n=1 Tax=Mucilaginibacter gilvus TaxID=2305909 RepID=A0A444MI60_9SPHI|nr:AraC family transcriptional regulator [Mucilaginibacter gilvus]RWY47374.1 AraC family transcriptional regulator [Mucilaginibacter gilvus]
MRFEFTPNAGFNFLNAFAEHIGAVVENDGIVIPDSLGQGIIKRMRLTPDFSLIIHHYILKEALILQRSASEDANEKINALFHIYQAPPDYHEKVAVDKTALADVKTVRITSTNIASEMFFPSEHEIFFINVSTSRTALQKLLNIKSMNAAASQILTDDKGFLFFERMNLNMQNCLKAIISVEFGNEMSGLVVWIRVQELLYLLFDSLLQRDTIKHFPINKVDASRLIAVKDNIVADLGKPPQLTELTKIADMSISKLTDLYRQVFGDSIYNYYQKARMEKAGDLIMRSGYSVSEAGYALGFSNLSHFSRLFSKHYGTTPKKYVNQINNSKFPAQT